MPRTLVDKLPSLASGIMIVAGTAVGVGMSSSRVGFVTESGSLGDEIVNLTLAPMLTNA